jgi:hypothetical protein
MGNYDIVPTLAPTGVGSDGKRNPQADIASFASPKADMERAAYSFAADTDAYHTCCDRTGEEGFSASFTIRRFSQEPIPLLHDGHSPLNLT